MTPTPAASHIDQSTLPFARSTGEIVGGEVARLLNPTSWSRLRLLVDVVVLYLASSVALFADPRISGTVASRWLAAIFPLIVLAFLYASNAREDRLGGSLVDSTTHVLGVVSLAAMLTIALAAITGAMHPVGMAVRLWLFGGVYLAVARAVLLSIRRQAIRTSALATPTLIVGAGMVGRAPGQAPGYASPVTACAQSGSSTTIRCPASALPIATRCRCSAGSTALPRRSSEPPHGT